MWGSGVVKAFVGFGFWFGFGLRFRVGSRLNALFVWFAVGLFVFVLCKRFYDVVNHFAVSVEVDDGNFNDKVLLVADQVGDDGPGSVGHGSVGVEGFESFHFHFPLIEVIHAVCERFAL